MIRLNLKCVGACAALGVTLTGGIAHARTMHLLLQTERGFTLVDSDTIKVDGDTAEGWVSLFPARRFTDKGYLVRTRLRFDCTGARWEVLETQTYNRALEQISSEKVSDPQWTDVLPKTNQVPEIMAVCFGDFGGGKKPLPASATDKYLLDLVEKVSR